MGGVDNSDGYLVKTCYVTGRKWLKQMLTEALSHQNDIFYVLRYSTNKCTVLLLCVSFVIYNAQNEEYENLCCLCLLIAQKYHAAFIGWYFNLQGTGNLEFGVSWKWERPFGSPSQMPTTKEGWLCFKTYVVHYSYSIGATCMLALFCTLQNVLV